MSDNPGSYAGPKRSALYEREGQVEGRRGVVELAEEAEQDVWALIEPLRRWRWLIAGSTLLMMIASFAATKLLLTKWYQAMAIIHPVANRFTASNATTGASGFLSGGGGLMQQLASGGQSQEVWEYISVFESYGFTRALIEKYQLKKVLLSAFKIPPRTEWQAYRRMAARFDAQYELKSGNIIMHFDDPDPVAARLVLGYYIDALRQQLRNQAAEESKAAIASLEQQARLAHDSYVQTQLYQMVADQIEKELSAQVQADFAFKIIEAPVVPDSPVWPSATSNAILAGLLAAGALSTLILLLDKWLGRPQAR